MHKCKCRRKGKKRRKPRLKSMGAAAFCVRCGSKDLHNLVEYNNHKHICLDCLRIQVMI